MICKRLGVTRAGYYAWRSRDPSDRSLDDQGLVQQIRRVHEQSRGNYGSPRIAHQLSHEGLEVGRRRVARLMRLEGLQGRSARTSRRNTAGQKAFYASVPNRQRGVAVQRADQVWVGDVTYLRVNGQWRYLAAVLDRYSRRVLGWSVGASRTAALTTDALRHALRKRRPSPGLVFHSDRGIEYAAFEYREQLKRAGIVQSMNRPGKMNDNAHMESFFHTMKTESLHGVTLNSEAQLRRTLRSYIPFYNHQRLHSAVHYLPPVTFEKIMASQACVN